MKKKITFNKSALSDIQWHALTVEEVFAIRKTDAVAGLSIEEVKARREEFGFNRLTPRKGTPAWLRFLLQFHQPLVYILLISTVITLILQEWIDASVIFGVVFINAIIGFIQEAKAVKALEALARSMTAYTTVVRSGKEEKISSVELVPGDLVIVSSGDKVPADIRLFKSRDLNVNESALTGESVPVEKNTKELEKNTALADRNNMVYASTFVTYGQARGVVVATGDSTEVGRISDLISEAEDLKTPLTVKIEHFSAKLLYGILALAAITFVVGVLRGNSFVDMFMAAVALAVGAIPEGLPAAVTITLAIGVARMAKRNAIIRKLPAVETLGSTSVICSDKTGTLTENQMTVQRLYCGGELYEVSGVGYSYDGAIMAHNKELKGTEIALQECVTAGILCNDSRVVHKDGQHQVEGDPTEGALIVVAHKARVLFPGGLPALRRIDSIPFESEYQYMATLHEKNNVAHVVYLKGSLEKVLACCKKQMNAAGAFEPIDSKHIEKVAAEMASSGLRLLAFARMDVPVDMKRIDHENIADGFTFLGFQGMIDPARPEATEAVKICHQAGIRVKMITGDHELTARAIAQSLGIRTSLSDLNTHEELQAMSGKELEKLSDAQLLDIVDKVSVFARVNPEQKLRLVKALQAKGYVTAMTGDGVNDAPALKQANIGVAMGRGGTEVAKEAADMVLLDDNFASIEAAVEEGRCVFDNLRKFIVWTIPTNLGEGLAILIAIVAGVTLPIVPVQILWVNMTTAICLGLMLAFEPKEPDVMRRKPIDPHTPIMTKGLLIRIISVGTLLMAGVFGLFVFEKSLGSSLAQARTVAVNVLVFGELFYLFNCRSLTRSMFSVGFFSNSWIFVGVGIMILLQIAFTYLPAMNLFFHSAPIGLGSWIRILCAGAIVYFCVGLEKKFCLICQKDK